LRTDGWREAAREEKMLETTGYEEEVLETTDYEQNML
jgi:hypothetical protein